MVSHAQPPVAPALFVGRQAGAGILPDFDLYTLTGPVEGHPEGSTVSADTLHRLGYVLPAARANAAAPECAPAPLPTAAECPRQLCTLEVVRHPDGGWTIAAPVDATRSTRRIYRGWWARRAQASTSLASLFLGHSGQHPIAP